MNEAHYLYKWYKIIDCHVSYIFHCTYRSAKFRPSFVRLHDLVPPGILMIATETPEIRADVIT